MKCPKPENLNVNELVDEFASEGITVKGAEFFNGKIVRDNRFLINEDGFLHFELETGDEKKAAEIVANHNGTVVFIQSTIEEKLASVGLNLDDLKAALGL